MDDGNPYNDLDRVARRVRSGEHRAVVGGLWDEIGALQFRFLISNGLSPSSRLIDIGCGCFRLGVRAIEYLDPAHYFGVDVSQALLDAGYESELMPMGLADKLPRENLDCDGDFDSRMRGPISRSACWRGRAKPSHPAAS